MQLILLIVILFFIFTKIGRKIIGKILGAILESSLKIAITIALIIGGIWLTIMVVKWVLEHIILSLFILAIFIAINHFMEEKAKKEHAQFVSDWESKEVLKYTDYDISKIIYPFGEMFYEACANSVKFKNDFPYGRVKYFLNFFEHDIENEEPLFYAPTRTTNDDELREYGTLLTTAGIYISVQMHGVNKDKTSKSRNLAIPFSGMVRTKYTDNSLKIEYTNYKDTVTINKTDTNVSLNVINNLCEMLIEKGISRSIHFKEVYNYTEILDEKREESKNFNDVQSLNNGFSAAGVVSSMPNMQEYYDSVMHNMDQTKGGGGIAAEYGTTVLSKFTDPHAQMLGNDNAKNGADRVANGQLIQCKFMLDPNQIVKDAFFDHDYGKILIEVPRDKYNDCVKILDKKIKNGELESKGISKDANAEDYILKSKLTYSQGTNIAKAGCIESIAMDTLAGITCSATAGSITAVLTFANCVWHGMSPKDAARESLIVGAKTIGKSTFVYTVTMQLSRKNIANIFAGKNSKGVYVKTFENPFYKLGENLATKINTSIVKSSLGQKIGLKQISGRTVVSAGVVAVVTFGPDILRSLAGRISFKQLVKNSAIGGAGLAGAAIGQVIIPIPIIGSMIGGAASSFVAKKTLDHFIEDDAIEMHHILREEFIDIAMMSNLTKEEFDYVVEITLCNKKLPHVLRDMYAYGDSREYAREHIMNKTIQNVYSKRPVITNELFEDAIISLATEEN